MEVNPQNQYCCVQPQQHSALPQKCCTQVPVQNQPVQYPQHVQNQTVQTSPQTYQIPASTSGVNIQIFNPSVTAPGAQAPTYNVNSPCYPSNYYTNQYGHNGNNRTDWINTGTGNNNSTNGTNTNGTNTNGANTNSETNAEKAASSGEGSSINNDKNVESGNNNDVDNNNKNKQNSNNTNITEETTSSKKTEKKQIIQLTDEYIMNLENYLNSQDKNIRLHAAKEIYDRLDEDPSRKDDVALTALVNKMLQDPSQEIRVIALSALEGRIVNGDKTTAGILQNMQTKSDAYGQDAIDASKILLQMSTKPVEKEVEVDPMKKTTVKTTTETKTENKKE